MEEDNKYIKRQKIYKIIMLMILTAFVTSILTAIYIVKLDGNTQTTNNSGVSSILNVFNNLLVILVICISSLLGFREFEG